MWQSGSPGIAMMRANFEQLRDAMVEVNYITPQQFDEDLARLNNPRFMMPSAILWLAWGETLMTSVLNLSVAKSLLPGCPATVSNLRRNPSAEINVVDPMVRKGYRFKGVASVVTEGALFERILDFYRTERNLDEGRTRIRSFVMVKINEAMPLISPAYDQGLTEEQIREKMQQYFDSLQRKNSTTRPEEM
jgi:hypothetical protein